MRVLAVRSRAEIVRYHVTEFYYFSLNLLANPRVVVPLTTAFLLFMPHAANRFEFPLFRVVIDPGHGGVGIKPMSVHGDRYDSIGRRYLDQYKEGAARGKLHERVIVYSIAKKAEALLAMLAPGKSGAGFYKILGKYSATEPRRINVITFLSRGPSLTESEAAGQKDPNGPFRIFDYPTDDFRIEKGRLSRMNAVRPHLVVSLHLAEDGPREYQGMSPVIVPPYDILEKGLDYLQGKRKSRAFFYKSDYRDWFVEETTRSDFEWFMNDVSLYFTGYPLSRGFRLNRSGFKGYRQNMVWWAYADRPGWEHAARYRIPNSRYDDSIKTFNPEGRFWDRERSVYERYRRGGGEEGHGGDNTYASREIARCISYALNRKGGRRVPGPGKSYVSVWIVPLYVNAVTAFLELGYLNRTRDREILTGRQDEIAEGVAVGIYSLLAGITPKENNGPVPRGKRIDFEKYTMPGGGTYFDEVIDE